MKPIEQYTPEEWEHFLSKCDPKLRKQLESIKRKKVAQLKEMGDYREANLIEFFDKEKSNGLLGPNPIQAELLEAWLDPSLRVFTYTGANQIGKTTILVIVAYSVMFGKYLWSGQKLHFTHAKPRKLRLIGQDWNKHIKSVLVPELKKWWPKNRGSFSDVSKKDGQGIETFIEDPITKSTLEIMSNKQESELHEGWRGDFIGYDEPPKRAIRVANSRGLMRRKGRELFCMTLLKEAWISRDVIKCTDEKGRPDSRVFNVHGEIYSNLGYGLDEEGIDDFKSKLSDDEIQARIHGVPSYMAGLVYPQFKRRVHLKPRDPMGVPLDWMVDIGIDVHPREKQAILFLATDRWNRKWGIQEIWEHGNAEWIAEQIVRTVRRYSYRVNRVIIDPLSKGDKNEINTSFDRIARVLMRHDMVLETAGKDKSSGIIQVKKYLKGPNDEPSLFFYDDLVNTIREVEGYMWDEDTQKPRDKDDHFMENLYRLILLDTKYVEPDEFEEEDSIVANTGRSKIGGY